MKETRISRHFTLEELTFSQTASRKGIDNKPPLEVVTHLTRLAYCMEQVRALLGGPVRITSGYRSQALNAAIGGAKNSAHMNGYAADFVCPSFGSPLEIVKAPPRAVSTLISAFRREAGRISASTRRCGVKC